MKKRARETMEPTSNIMNACTSGLSQAGMVNIKILITSIEN